MPNILDGLGLEGFLMASLVATSTTRKEWFAITRQLIQQTIAEMDRDPAALAEARRSSDWPALTRKRVTASEKKQRHEWAVRQIDAGMGLSELTAFTAETWG